MNGALETALASIPDTGMYSAFLGSLITGVFGWMDAKNRDKAAAKAAKVPQVTTNTVDAVALRAAAEAGGFNPVTFLEAGGIGGFTTSTTTGHNAMAAVPTAPSLGSVVAGSIMGTIDKLSTFGSVPSMGRASSGGKTASQLLNYQLGGATLGGGAVSAPSGRSTSSKSFSTPTVKTAGSLLVGFGSGAMGQPQLPEIGKVTVTNPHFDYGVDPTRRDAEMYETRYGDSELFNTVHGINTYWDDFFYNVTGQTRPERGARTRQSWKAKGLPTATWGPTPNPEGAGGRKYEPVVELPGLKWSRQPKPRVSSGW